MRLSYVTSGSSGTLRRLRVQWRGLARRAWPAVAFKVCPLRAAPSARHLAAALHPLVANAGRSLCTQWPVWGSDASAFTIAGPDVSWWAHSGPPRVPLARQTPPPLCPAWHLAAPRCSLCARALRPLYIWWAIGGPNESACTMVGPGVAWLARSGLQGVPAARQPPLLCPRGTSPQLCTPWLRTPSACCARSGQTVALMCGLVQWCDLMQCCWPQKTRALFTAVRRTPPSFSRTINTTVHTHLLSF